MRGLENIIAAIIVTAMIVSLASAAVILVSRMVYSGIHVISTKAMMAIPPSMELKPLSNTCNNGYLPAKLHVGSESLRDAKITLYDLRGRVVGIYRGNDVVLNIPCNESVIITISGTNGFFTVYRYELDPGMRCLSGYLVNASILLRGCPSSNSIEQVYPSMLQPIWIRSVLVNDNDALNMLKRYGPVPGLVVNESETLYTIINRHNYSYIFVPRPVAYAALYSKTGYVNIIDKAFPLFCKPGIGCAYVRKLLHSPYAKDSNITMHVEYEYSSFVIEQPGWIHVRDYRVVLPLRIVLASDPDGVSFGWGFNYTWWIEGNLSPPFFYARVMENATRLSNGYTRTICSRKSISSIYARAIDILLVPLLVSRNTTNITVSFAILPVQYSVHGALYWASNNAGTIFTEKRYGSYPPWSQYIAMYAYLVPLSEWGIGIPVENNILQTTTSLGIVKAVYRKTLLNLTRIVGNATSGNLSINVGEVFDKAKLLDERAILVIEIVLASNGSRLIVDTTNNTDISNQPVLCNLGIAYISGIDDYIHLSILPSTINTRDRTWILLAPGEAIQGYRFAYNVKKIYLQEYTNIEFRDEHANGYYMERFQAESIAVNCNKCTALQVLQNTGKVINNYNGIETIGTIELRLRECASASTIWENFSQKGRAALITR